MLFALRSARPTLLFATATFALSAACSAILGLDAPPAPDGGELSPDATTLGDAKADSSGPSDGSSSSDAPMPPTEAGTCTALSANLGPYNPLSQVALDDAGTSTWDFFDISQLDGFRNVEFSGATFDGRFIYFAERSGGYIPRYDTTAGSFTDAGSWSLFKLSLLGMTAGGFLGAVYDGRYVYFVPYQIGPTPDGVVARYDSSGLFTDAASWATFDVSTLAMDGGPPTKGFTGGVFDGRYVYLVPRNDGAPDGRVVRHDTLAPDGGAAGDAGEGGAPESFADPTLWTTFDVSSTNPGATGFAGGVFDGEFVYLVPSVNDELDAEVHGGASSIVTRFRMDGGFMTNTSWSTFDVSNVNGLAGNDFGGGYDGRYVYFAPRSAAIALQFDTKSAALSSLPAWSAYDLTRHAAADAAAGEYAGTAFDGRFLYLVPTGGSFATVIRYDTMSAFSADCAWSTVDLRPIGPSDAGAGNFIGAVFDGQYVYFVPSANGVVARFNARTPAPLPALPWFSGSFL